MSCGSGKLFLLFPTDLQLRDNPRPSQSDGHAAGKIEPELTIPRNRSRGPRAGVDQLTRQVYSQVQMAMQSRAVRRTRRTAPPAILDQGTERRHRILGWIRDRRSPVRGGELARHFRVSRQCVVQDIAILRASGEEILATPRGYRLPQPAASAHRTIIACRHEPERTEEELNILVDHGVKVLDVIVEHPLYGELRGALMLETRADVQDFLSRAQATNASLLSSLTGGVHLHTLEAARGEMVDRAKSELRARGFLLK